MGTASHRLLLLGAAPGYPASLRKAGFEVHYAERLAPGLALLAEGHIDLVLLDLASAETGGLDIFARVHAAAAHVPIIVLTRTEDDELSLATLRRGAQDALPIVPPDPVFLSAAIHKAVARHHAHDIIRRDQHLLEILMNNIPDAIYFKDTESRFLRINLAHARRFGLAEPALAIGKTDADFFTEAHAQQALADERQVMKTGLPLVGIEEMETWPDGTISWVSTTKMPLRDPTGKIIGSFGMSRDITARKEAELALAERTRQLHQKNQQMEEELKMARELQLAMLPQKFPLVTSNGDRESALEFFSFYFPNGSVSGDFFDVVELSNSAVGLFICDVMGHDVRAALVTAMMRSLVEDLSHTVNDPGQLLTQINRGLSSVFRQTGSTMYATAFYLIADVANREVRYASAAHPDALHLHRQRGSVEALDSGQGRKGPALGLFEEAKFPSQRCPLAPGDLIVLFTDGLIEVEGASQECFSRERLAAAVRQRVQLPANDILREVIGEIREFCAGAEFGDDVSLLGMEVRQLAKS